MKINTTSTQPSGQWRNLFASHGVSGVKRFSISLGRPVQAMLARRVDTIEELNKRFPDEMA